MICGIYSIRNKINHKIYIGSSHDIKLRWKTHIYHLNKGTIQCNDYLLKQWKKYGKDNFEFKIIEECDESILEDRENYWMQQYKSMDRKYGYNLKEAFNGRLSEDTKIKISKSNKGKTKGIHRPIEVKEKISNFYKTAPKELLDRNIFRGEKNGMAKLSDEDILNIWKENLDAKTIRERFNISRSQSFRIASRKTRTYLLEKL